MSNSLKDKQGLRWSEMDTLPLGLPAGLGLMVHTVFASAHDEAIAKYESMKVEIARFLNSGHEGNLHKAAQWCEEFTAMFM